MVRDLTTSLSIPLASGDLCNSKKPSPIIYLTSWKMVGNSEVHNNEIWSCGELLPNGKYIIHISNGRNVFNVELDEPIRKVGKITDTIEFATDDTNTANVIRRLSERKLSDITGWYVSTATKRILTTSLKDVIVKATSNASVANMLCSHYSTISADSTKNKKVGISIDSSGSIIIYDSKYDVSSGLPQSFLADSKKIYAIMALASPNTSRISVPQIAESKLGEYKPIISPNAKAIGWYDFVANHV